MGKHSKTAKKLLFVAGTIEIIMGVAHFLMPGLIYKSAGFLYLNTVEANVVTLCIFSVGILLIAIGFISIVSDKMYDTSKELALNISIINLLLWSVRIIFEIMMPFKITILSIKNPTIFVMPLFVALWLIIGSAVILIWTDKQKQ